MINIRNLHFSYRRKKVFSGLNLELKAGHIYGLLGKNGTGKSTLLRNIAGLLFPGQGTVTVMDFKPGKREPLFLQQVFLIPEEFYLPNISVKQFIRNNAPFYPLFNAEQFENYLVEFEIPRDNNLQEMSYGQKKKLLISFGLACNTRCLLMDEPTNGLDIMSKSQFRKVLAGAVDENKCIIISTHQVKDLESLIDRISIIDQGSILFDENIETITRKLSFRLLSAKEELSAALYHEPSLTGYAAVTANIEGEESRLDLEMLYKAIITNKEKVQAVFKSQVS
jgi:ABC-2 type transport system ATP-binding protein